MYAIQLVAIITKLQQELNAPERHVEMQDHAAMLVSDVLSGISGIQSVPQLKSPQLPNERTIEQRHAAGLPAPGSARSLENTSLDEGDAWLDQINTRIENERKQRLARDGSAAAESSSSGVSAEDGRRLVALAAAAETKGYDLPTLERLLGLSPDFSGSTLERLSRLAAGASKWGYSIDDLEKLLGASAAAENGGDDVKKK